jgi:hypothetical protein
MPTKTCALLKCSGQFVPVKPFQRYCDEKCRGAAYRERNRERVLARQRAYGKTKAGREWHRSYTSVYWAKPENRFRLLTNGARLRAIKRGMRFEEGLLASILAAPPTHCACCGVPLDYSMGRGRNNMVSRSPSLDRIDPREGYTIRNVAVICMRCNTVKGDATLEELRVVCGYVADRDVNAARNILALGLSARGGAVPIRTRRRSAKPKSCSISDHTDAAGGFQGTTREGGRG